MAKDKTLELSIKIAGKVDKSLINAINQAQGNVSSLATTFSHIGTVGLAAMGALATGTVAAIVKCTDAAKDFESQMGDVVKYVDGLADANGKISDSVWAESDGGNGKTYAENYADMSKALLNLSTQIPMTAEELTQLAAAAGQSGKDINDLIQYDDDGNIAGFLKDVAMMGTAMDISAEQAGDWAAKWEVAFGMTHDDVKVLSDQINYLGANNATTAAEIAQVVNDAASLGQVAGVSADTTAALGTAMLAMGVDGSKAATSISRMYTNLSLGASATKAQKEMWESLGFTATGVAKSMQEDATGTIKSVFEAVGNLDKDKQVAALKTLFGQWAIQGAAKLTGNLEAFTNTLDMVNNPELYTGSMEREFIIKASTSEAIDSMMSNAFKALQIDVGTAFLPAKKELSVAMIDFINQLRDMEELPRVAEMLANLFGKGIGKIGDALESAMPIIEKALGYIADHGPQVAKAIGGLAAAFTAMKFAPGIEALLLGSGTGGSAGTGSGGIVGALGTLFKGGQNAASGLAALPGNVVSWIQSAIGAARIDAALSGGNLLTTLLQSTRLGGSIGGYLGGIGSSLGNFFNVSGITGVARTIGQILSGIGQATGLTNLVNGAIGGVTSIPGKIVGLASNVVNSAPIQAIGGFAGKVVSSAPVQGIASMASGAAGWLGNVIQAGAGALGSIWGLMASRFGSIFAGAAPVIAVISSIIAVVSILGDHLEDIRGIVGNVFGEKGLAIFDSFMGALQSVGDFITGLFQDGGVAAALAPLRDAITGIFGDDAGAAFDGLVQILQSVMSVVGQIVSFATTTVKPIIQDIFSFITQTIVPIILQTFTAAAPAISGIISGLGTAIMTGMQIIGTAIQLVLPIIQGLISAFLSIASVVIPAVLSGWEIFATGISTVISGVQTTFSGLIDFITGVFTGNWSQAWQGVQDIFKGIFEALGGLIKTPINAVIAVINKAISGINGLGLTIPDWVPVIGGNSFSLNIPSIPMLAQGGFTNGVSIAGEAGREAVISFQPGVRSENIDTWIQAGRMLGVDGKQAAASVSNIAYYADGGFTGGNGAVEIASTAGANRRAVELETVNPSNSPGGGPGFSIKFAPQLIFQGNADRETVEKALIESEQRFEAWMEANFERLYNRMERERGRRAY